ncbi:hypothetical protein O1K_06552 [Xanthomonas fragariae LMG 25863]|nr:hypothetical protein O1K_06552 [Xanthomonas fragariae LMG 25863]
MRSLILAAMLFNGPVLATVVDVDKPYKPQVVKVAQVRADLAHREKCSRISQEERAKVTASLDWIEAVLEAQPDVQRRYSQTNWQPSATIRSSPPAF